MWLRRINRVSWMSPYFMIVDLTIESGSLIVFVGPSGFGKTHLLNLIGAVDRPTSGTVKFGGVDLGQLSDRQRTQFRRKSVGFFSSSTTSSHLSQRSRMSPSRWNCVQEDSPRTKRSSIWSRVSYRWRDASRARRVSGGT